MDHSGRMSGRYLVDHIVRWTTLDLLKCNRCYNPWQQEWRTCLCRSGYIRAKMRLLGWRRHLVTSSQQSLSTLTHWAISAKTTGPQWSWQYCWSGWEDIQYIHEILHELRVQCPQSEDLIRCHCSTLVRINLLHLGSSGRQRRRSGRWMEQTNILPTAAANGTNAWYWSNYAVPLESTFFILMSNDSHPMMNQPILPTFPRIPGAQQPLTLPPMEMRPQI